MVPKKAKKAATRKKADTFTLFKTTPLLVEGAIVESVDIIAICFSRMAYCLSGCQPFYDDNTEHCMLFAQQKMMTRKYS